MKKLKTDFMTIEIGKPDYRIFDEVLKCSD